LRSSFLIKAMDLHRQLIVIIFLFLGLCAGCAKTNPVTPTDNDLLQIKVTRVHTDQPTIDSVRVIATRTSDGIIPLPGQKIEISSDTGHVGAVIDHNDGTYDVTWTGGTGEVTVTVRDPDTTPVLQNRLTFLVLDYLDTDWDIPVKLAAPISTDGWEAAPFLYPNGNRMIFSYVTLDLAAAAADVLRPIGQERPGQVTPQILNLFIGQKPTDAVAWWTGWTVEHPDANFFMTNPAQLSAPSITSDGLAGFCTVQEYTPQGYTPTTLYRDDPDFRFAPIPLGQPVDMAGLGEDNPYYDVTHGWLYFDTYDLSDQLSKQDMWASRSLGGGTFDVPQLISGGLNTASIETQGFVYEPDSMLYFASDREQPDFRLSIWKVPVYGSQSDGTTELVARGFLAIGRPSISLDGNLLCFSYAREESGGANADIAIAPRLK
jgi:hypothetical protein